MTEKVKFQVGSVVVTASVMAFLDQQHTSAHIYPLLQRHMSGDWGNVCAADKSHNDDSLKHGARLLSSYEIRGRKVWIMTDAADEDGNRLHTTILFPEDY